LSNTSKKKKSPSIPLETLLIESIQEKKGHQIVQLDLAKIEDSITDNYIICHGNSTTQVKAIANFITENVKKQTGEMPWHLEGLQNSEWVLIDYIDVVVHVFLNEKRFLYNLEELWSDAEITEFEDV